MLPNYSLSLASALALVVQVVLPVLVGLVTKSNTSGALKSLLLLGLTGVTELATVASASDHFDWKTGLFNLVIGFGISVATYYGLYKPTGIAEAAQNSLVK